MLNLDTHMVVWYVAGRLSPEEHRCLTGQDLAISDIVLWELAMLAEESGLSFNLDHPEFQAFLPYVRVFPSPWRSPGRAPSLISRPTQPTKSSPPRVSSRKFPC